MLIVCGHFLVWSKLNEMMEVNDAHFSLFAKQNEFWSRSTILYS